MSFLVHRATELPKTPFRKAATEIIGEIKIFRIGNGKKPDMKRTRQALENSHERVKSRQTNLFQLDPLPPSPSFFGMTTQFDGVYHGLSREIGSL